MADNTPYTYLIGWSSLNTWYYGVRYASKCSPSDLWVSYFTSSEYVKEFRKKNGEPDVITIRKIFNNVDSARLHEHKALIRLKAALRPDFLNKSYVLPNSPEKHHMKTEFHKKRQSDITSGEKNPMYGKKHSQESNHKRSISLLGRKNAIDGKTLVEAYGVQKASEIKLKLSNATSGEKNPMYGKKHKTQSKLNISKNRIGKYSDENNGNAKIIILDGVQYLSIKEAVNILGISRYKISKLLEKNNG